MKRLALLAALIGTVLLCTGERATAQVSLNETPAVISVGTGWYDLIHQDDEAVDFRLEYRHGEDFLYLKPWSGLEVTTDSRVWVSIGVLVEVTLFGSVVLTGRFRAEKRRGGKAGVDP